MPNITPSTKLYKPTIVKKEIDDSHYYYVDGKFFPGVTTILHETLPMPFALRKWLGDVGTERATQKFERAGERGTAIHEACERLLLGEEVNLDLEFPAKKDKKCMVAFTNWIEKVKPVIKDSKHIEMIVASESGFAGTVDLVCEIDKEPWILDWKTSAGVYDSHKLQLIAYQQALYEMTGIRAKIGILHLNFRTKRGYTLVEKMEISKRPLEFADFMKVFEVYKMLNGGKIPEPPIADLYPPIISLYQKENT